MVQKFNKNEYVVYGSTGVCFIEDVKPLSFSAQHEEKPYYILKPVADHGSTIFAACDNDALTSKMRYVLTKDEIDELLSGIKDQEITWIEDRQERTECFRSIVRNGNQQKLLLLVSCIYMKKNEKSVTGKKLPASDENFLKSAEKLIGDEFSFSLRLSGEQVSRYIREKLGLDDPDAAE